MKNWFLLFAIFCSCSLFGLPIQDRKLDPQAMIFLAFLFLIGSFLSLWVRKDPKIWGSLLGLSLTCGLIAGNIAWIGLVFIIALLLLWIIYDRKPNIAFFLLIIAFSTAFKMHFLPGYTPYFFTPKFAIGLDVPLVGLFPLAFAVLLARGRQDWIAVIKGTFIGCIGIALLAFIAIATGATHWQFKVPTFAMARLLSNFLFTCIPEEGLYRGFIQSRLCQYFAKIKYGKCLALLITSLLFTLAHIYWSPNAQILGFVFLASLLYGGVYLISGKVESAILCHFILNFIHMMFFSYHAM